MSGEFDLVTVIAATPYQTEVHHADFDFSPAVIPFVSVYNTHKDLVIRSVLGEISHK